MEEFPQPVLHPAGLTIAHKIAPGSLSANAGIDNRAAQSLAPLLLCSAAKMTVSFIVCSGHLRWTAS